MEYRFEGILDYGKADNGRWQYLVKWEDHQEPTWQPATDLRGCDDAIWAFHDAHPEAPGPPSWVRRRRRRGGYDEEEEQGHDEGEERARREQSPRPPQPADPQRRSARLAGRAPELRRAALRSILRKPQRSRF